MDLDDALTSRETINTELREILDEATDVWGTRVVRVEIQRIDPPMEKRSAILKAEGIKQARILDAEGQAQAIKEVADAERYQKQTVAEGEGRAIERVFGAIHTGDPTPDLIAIEYLKALQGIADGKATKIYLPMETTSILASIGVVGELFADAQRDEGEI